MATYIITDPSSRFMRLLILEVGSHMVEEIGFNEVDSFKERPQG